MNKWNLYERGLLTILVVVCLGLLLANFYLVKRDAVHLGVVPAEPVEVKHDA